MAGLGRRTHYRKHLTDSVLHDLPQPDPPHSRLGKIVATRGSNQFDVKLEGGQEELAILPTKFRKLVWLKRNDFVIVGTVEDDDKNDEEVESNNKDSSSGIRCMISHILYQEQIKNLISKGLWPKNDPDFEIDDRKMMMDSNPEKQAADDGIVYDDAFGEDEQEYGSDGDATDDPLLFVNTNRIARMAVQDSSSDEEEEG